ncbi:MAG TPA: ABC transporter [Lachnospiraceae bacterium]|nr:ABC transporter ATP-binding protein [Lachnospiraceae bacterium]MCR4786370.1 ABC transporter ATP-binding protein [Lachnospiraceae bacterium]HAL32283.1 ABC transporter [Lachnospiraceae bacterium]HBB59031.1 ABC transporter [Lachnospiraceae bacterium]HCS00744.1 ABC transporter [Lachnospiraceae bacterium]
MIEAVNVTKSFGDIVAVDDVTLSIESGKVFGLIGTNGAGKSTFLRMIAGVLKPDSGTIEIDGRPVFENPACKEDFFYISDEAYFFLNATADEMERFYEMCYPTYSRERYEDLMGRFELDRRRKISTFSKGMKKQLSVILGLASNTRYMLCDETFDGLDPVMRQGVKSLFAQDMADREFTPVIASHNLRELEDICDTVGLLYKGGMLLSEDLDDIKVDIHKVQVVFPNDYDPSELLGRLRILEQEKRGSLYTIIARGKQDELNGTLMEGSPVFIEALPLSLEEIFITSTGVEGYDIKKIIY